MLVLLSPYLYPQTNREHPCQSRVQSLSINSAKGGNMALIPGTWVDEYKKIVKEQTVIANQQKNISKWVAGFIAGSLILQAVGLVLPYVVKP